MKLTKKQEKVYWFIRLYIEKRRIPPSIRDIGEKFGYKSHTSAVDVLKALEKKGKIKRIPKISRGIIIL